MSFRRILFLSLLLALVFTCIETHAQTSPAPNRPLQVGIKSSPPFIIIAQDSSLSGITIDLWKRMAAELNLNYEYTFTDLKELVDGLATKRFDIVVAPLTITADRETRLDFSHSYFSAGLGIVVPARGSGGWAAAASQLFSTQFLQVVLALVILLLIIGLVVWLFERRRNPEMFGGSAAHGIGSGFWWSAVTMTTVGYGDKAPITVGGRIIGLIWMFAALIVISSFTAAITSSLTVSHLESGITGLEDLHNARVLTVGGSATASYLDGLGIEYRQVPTVEEGLAELNAGKADAMVYDIPLLKYLINESYKGRLRILPGNFVSQNYAFGLTEGSPLTEQLNREMLKVISGPDWRRIVDSYLGK